MPWILDLKDLKAHAEDGRWELAVRTDGSVVVNFYTKHGSMADSVAAQGFAQEGTEMIACGQRDRDAVILAESNIELLKALEKAAVLVEMAYQTPQWLQECRSEESDEAREFILKTLVTNK